jgi:hypothetical protein
MPAEPAQATDDRISYAAFGVGFFEHAISAERILGALSDLAGDPIEFGPVGAGPGRLAQVKANGQIGQPSVGRLEGEEVAFHLSIPIELDLQIDLRIEKHNFHASVGVALTLVARAAPPLRIVIDINEPRARDVDVKIEAEGVRATVLQYAAGIDREIAKFIANYVRREIDKPRIRAAREIDVAARIDKAWPG